MARGKKLKVSIIIPTFNRREDLINCLATIFTQGFKDFEVIVVDDCSVDKTKEFLERGGWLKKIIYLKNRKRLGVSKTKNKAIKQARGEYCWFLDSDVKVLKKNCLDFLVKTLDTQSEVGSLGCEVIQRGQDLVIREHSFFSNDKTYPLKSKGKVGFKECDYLATCNCFARTSLVKKIGGFNEYYFYGYEDAELGKRIADLGFKNVMDPKAQVLHLRSAVSRTANYPLFFKNRIRFAIWNFPISQIIKLPFIDIRNVISSVLEAQKVEGDQIKGQSESIINKIFGKVGFFVEYIFGLFYGYIWNLFFLPQTLALRGKRKFLNNV